MRNSTTTSRPSQMHKAASGVSLGFAIVMLILIGSTSLYYLFTEAGRATMMVDGLLMIGVLAGSIRLFAYL